MNPKRILGCAAVLLVAATVLSAQAPTVMNYQGRLTDNTPQQNAVDAVLPMEFRVYDIAVGGAPLWTEPWAGVDVVDGIFSVLLGSNGSPLGSAVFSGGAGRYLEIVIDGEVLTPRQQIGSVGYADVAALADALDCIGCVGADEVLDGSIQAADIATGAVGAAEIATDAVGASEIAADAVGASEIAPNSV